MSERCYTIEEFDALGELPAGDERLRHAQECPRCRTQLASLREFRALRGEAQGSEERRAEAVLTNFLEREIGAATMPAAAARRRQRREGSLRAWWRSRALPPALAAGLAALAVIALWHPWGPHPGDELILRGPADDRRGGEVRANAPVVQGEGRLLLSWNRLPEAEGYRVLLYTPGMTELARFESGPDSMVLLTQVQLAALASDAPDALWRVEALSHGDVVGRSHPRPLVLPSR